LIPIEIDLERVKKSREDGLLRLGQPLKSFRDRHVVFDIYEKDKKFPELDKLGSLSKPIRMKQIESALVSEHPSEFPNDANSTIPTNKFL
jgi:hypothetical protein